MSFDAASLAGRPLGRREIQTLQLLAEGYSMSGVAQELYVSVSTAKTFAAMLFAKLRAHTAAEAVAAGFRFGYLAVPPSLAEDLDIVRASREMGYQLSLCKLGGDA